ncbi:MAG: T9SS type A sorting domain-containing protein [Bacteroidales bacterium]
MDIPKHWKTFSNTPNFHVFIFPINLFINNNINFSYGDCIGAFYKHNDMLRCCGATVITEKDNLSVIAYADDSFTEMKDGFCDGDTIYWMLYKYNSNSEELFEVTYLLEDNLFSEIYFCSFAISIVDSILGFTNLIQAHGNSIPEIKVYPNPTDGMINMFGLNIERVLIYNSKVFFIDESKNNDIIDVTNFPSGIYCIKVISKDGRIYNQKIIKK